MTWLLGLGFPRSLVAISWAALAPTASISWKWVTPRYSLLYSAACISSLVMAGSPDRIIVNGAPAVSRVYLDEPSCLEGGKSFGWRILYSSRRHLSRGGRSYVVLLCSNSKSLRI